MSWDHLWVDSSYHHRRTSSWVRPPQLASLRHSEAPSSCTLKSGWLGWSGLTLTCSCWTGSCLPSVCPCSTPTSSSASSSRSWPPKWGSSRTWPPSLPVIFFFFLQQTGGDIDSGAVYCFTLNVLISYFCWL